MTHQTKQVELAGRTISLKTWQEICDIIGDDDPSKALRVEKLCNRSLAQAQQEAVERELQNLRISIKQVIGTNAVFLLPSQTERCVGLYKKGLYKVIGIDVTKDIQEALQQEQG